MKPTSGFVVPPISVSASSIEGKQTAIIKHPVTNDTVRIVFYFEDIPLLPKSIVSSESFAGRICNGVAVKTAISKANIPSMNSPFAL